MAAQLEIPSFLAHLPVDRHHRPIPWFVHRDPDGIPDFRVIAEGAMRDAHRFNQCWVCGRTRGRHAAFVIGPMCAVNRVSAEPPSHLRCAEYSARACPFLATPTMTRRERHLPEDRKAPAGVALSRNPGVALVWSSKTWEPFRAPVLDGAGYGVLWNVGAPTATSWWCEGREATRAEVEASIESGLPHLREACQQDRDPADSLALLDQQVATARRLLPVA